MLSDRELLELAALAAGIKGQYAGLEDFPDWMRVHDGAGIYCTDSHAWNPLTDDGDALRLAVKLAMYVALDNAAREVVACAAEGDVVKEWCGDDAYAATRRAIVRSAAEIGRQMGDGNAE